MIKMDQQKLYQKLDISTEKMQLFSYNYIISITDINTLNDYIASQFEINNKIRIFLIMREIIL